MSLNSVNLIGRLTKDVELKTVGEGIKKGTFTLAVDRSYVNNEILREKEDNENFSIDTKRLRSYFPREFTPAQCKKILWEILDEWFDRR